MYKESIYNYRIQTSSNQDIIYNTLSGALIRVEHSADILSAIDLEVLVNNGFVLDSLINEEGWLEARRQSLIWKTNPIHLSFVIAPTMNCQANCYYCFEKSDISKKTMGSETAIGVFEYIKSVLQKCKSQFLHITFFWRRAHPQSPHYRINRI